MSAPLGRILIVDDQAMNLDALSRLLQIRHYETAMVESGAEALEAVRAQPPDLILLDINMPGMDGFETCARLKADPEMADIPVIFLSALGDSLDKVKAFKAGGADYVVKPFQVDEVAVRIAHQLRLQRLQAQLEDRNHHLEEAYLKLQELDHLKAGFTAMLIHDLRSPLTVLGVALETYASTGKLPGRLQEQAGQAYEKLRTLLEEVLEVFRSEGGGMILSLDSVDPQDLAHRALSGMEVAARAKGVELVAPKPGEHPVLRVDGAKLERALANLVANAIKFTAAGGRVEMNLALQEGQGVEAGLRFLAFTVKDTGRGIPADQLPYIFDPYRQTAKGDAEMGFGLGLAIVQRIVAAHHGRLGVQSQVGVGTEFTLALPLGA